MTDSYDVSGVFADGALDAVPPGTNIAIVGPSMSGKRELALQLLAAGYDDGDAILCITTESSRRVYRDLERHVPSVRHEQIGIIDCSGSEGREAIERVTEQVSSPSDLTGISIGTAKQFKRFRGQGITDIRHGLISISTLLQYLGQEKVFKFLHIYNNRIEDTDGLGVYTLDDDAHSQKIVNTMLGLFDGVARLRETDDGTQEFQIRGFGRRPSSWTELD